jgi:hypothetical protein
MYASTIQRPQDGFDGVQAVYIDERKLTVLNGTITVKIFARAASFVLSIRKLPETDRNYTYLCFLKVHKIEIFFGFDFEICIISLLVM